jgi:hypothetical protein
MLRQQSYKIAQTQQILPPLPFPLSESESEDLLAFQQIVENPTTSQKLLKTTHLHSSASLSPSLSPQPPAVASSDSAGIWNNLPNSLQASCQISDASTNVATATAASHELFHHQPLFHQVYYYR